MSNSSTRKPDAPELFTLTETPAARPSRKVSLPLYTCSLVRDSSVKAESKLADCASAAAAILHQVIGDADREHFVMMALDSRRQVIGCQVVSIGTLSASLVHPREVFKPAILMNAAAVVVSHNHPSFDVSPSAEDKEATRRLVRAGELLGIPVADHIIIGGPGKFFSFRDGGLL